MSWHFHARWSDSCLGAHPIAISPRTRQSLCHYRGESSCLSLPRSAGRGIAQEGKPTAYEVPVAPPAMLTEHRDVSKPGAAASRWVQEHPSLEVSRLSAWPAVSRPVDSHWVPDRLNARREAHYLTWRFLCFPGGRSAAAGDGCGRQRPHLPGSRHLVRNPLVPRSPADGVLGDPGARQAISRLP